MLYSGTHDRTIRAVIDGTVDAGVVNGQLFEHWLKDGRNDLTAVRVLWQSPAYPNYVWAVQPSMTSTTRQSIKAAFLALATDDAAQSRFLDVVGAKYFVPAAVSDFDRIGAAIREVGTMPEGTR